MTDEKPGAGGAMNRPQHPDAPTGGKRKPAEGDVPEGPVGDAALNEEAEKNEEGIDRSKTPGRTFDV